MLSNKQLHARRRGRQRANLKRIAQRNPDNTRPRLSVFRSSQHIYAQIIDDASGKTLVAAASNDKELKAKIKTGATVDAAKQVGAALAARAKKTGVSKVVFDRSGYIYHGRIKALADAAREGGMEF
ncbi:MAG: 50S ribosomal protein L18 [Bdellovibrionales bacterium]